MNFYRGTRKYLVFYNSKIRLFETTFICFTYTFSQKWNLVKILNTRQWDKNLKKISFMKNTKKIYFA